MTAIESFPYLVSIGLTFVLVAAVGISTGRRVKTVQDFSVGGNQASAAVVAGTIVGTLFGGGSTVGAAQMAFKVGLSGWWFALGSGLGCLLLALFLARPLRQAGLETVTGYLGRVYGPQAAVYGVIFVSMGMFLNIIPQILAATAMISSLLGISTAAGAVLAVTMVVAYVTSGGVWGAGRVGILKSFLLYLCLVVAGYWAYHLAGGLGSIRASLPSYPYFSLFGRGLSKDLAAGFSVVVGVLSTQTYIQAIFSGRDVATSRRGALLSAVFMVPLGFAGILVGWYMKITQPTIDPAQAFPRFVLEHLNPWIGGVVLATLIIAVIGTAAGLTLGAATMLTTDVYAHLFRPGATSRERLWVMRIIVAGITAFSAVFVAGNLSSMILGWSFLSMALRGATICFPLLAAIFFRGLVPPKAGVAAVVAAPLVVVLWSLLVPKGVDPLYPGLGVSMLVLAVGAAVGARRGKG